MSAEREAIVWCPRCRSDKYEVWRVPAENAGVYTNITVPPSLPVDARKFCICGANLERKR